jgi:hypothetical protein
MAAVGGGGVLGAAAPPMAACNGATTAAVASANDTAFARGQRDLSRDQIIRPRVCRRGATKSRTIARQCHSPKVHPWVMRRKVLRVLLQPLWPGNQKRKRAEA